ncbi:H+ Antiporter protein [Chlamydia trachomatis]|nr:H+ Antiporter protein [Chlamydia trachomatis]
MNIFVKNNLFRQLTINQWFSNLGDTIFYLAFINYVSSYSFAPLAIFLITLSETIPQILQVFLGVVADFQKSRVSKYIIISFAKFLLYTGVAVVLMWTNFSILSVALICMINFLSDSLGFFASSMLTPIYVRIMGDDITEGMGFRQATSSIVRILGNLGGGILLGIIDIGHFALINALTFLVAFIGISLIRKKMNYIEKEIDSTKSLTIQNFCNHLVESMKILLKNKEVVTLLWVLSVSQSIVTIIGPVSTLVLIKHPFLNMVTGQSIAILTLLSLIGLVFGGLFSGSIAKKISIRTNIYISQAMEFLILVGIFQLNFYLILIGLLGDAISIGALSPRLQSLIFNLIPEESMGAIQAAIGMLTVVLPGILSISLVGIAGAIGTKYVAIGMVILLALAIGLTMKFKKFII